MKAMLMIFTVLMTAQAFASPAPIGFPVPTDFPLPAKVTCAGDDGMSLEGVVAQVPGEAQFKVSMPHFTLSQVNVKWQYQGNCFISRAGEHICYAPHELRIEMKAPYMLDLYKWNGEIGFGSEKNFGYLNEVEPAFGAHTNMECSWTAVPAPAPAPTPKQCKVPPQNDCSRGPKRLCCDCEDGHLVCN